MPKSSKCVCILFHELRCAAFTYFVARACPIFVISPDLVIFPRTASTVVGLTSGRNNQKYAYLPPVSAYNISENMQILNQLAGLEPYTYVYKHTALHPGYK